MSTRDQLRAAIDRLPDDRVAELYEHARRLEAPPPEPGKPADDRDIMERLLSIQFDGPPDLSSSLDAYLYGDPRAEPDVP